MSKEEFYAVTVEEAVAKAARTFNVEREELVYQILDSGSSGFLGIGARDARIEVHSDTQSNQNVGDPDDDSTSEAPAIDREVDREDIGSSSEPTAAVAEAIDSGKNAEEVSENLLDDVQFFVSGVTREMGLNARVNAYDAGEVIAVDVALGETGLFIGQKGETIDAIQYLTNVAVYKDREFVKKIVLDSEGYRQRRVEALEGMAHRAARRATREGRTVELAPMNSSERRVIHLYLKELANVSTHSEGNGEQRKVIVSPQ